MSDHATNDPRVLAREAVRAQAEENRNAGRMTPSDVLRKRARVMHGKAARLEALADHLDTCPTVAGSEVDQALWELAQSVR